MPYYERTSVELIEQAARGLPTQETGILLGLHAWNMHVALLERHRVAQVGDLPDGARETAARLRELAVRIVRQVYADAPYLGVTYPAGLSIGSQGDSSTVVRDTRRTR